MIISFVNEGVLFLYKSYRKEGTCASVHNFSCMSYFLQYLLEKIMIYQNTCLGRSKKKCYPVPIS